MRLRLHKRGLFAVVLLTAGILITVGQASASLPGSTFEGNDGNFVPNGGTDWTSPAPNRVVGLDQINSQSDNSFGQGTSENDTNVTVVTGSIPNSKADLAQFLIANEQAANGHTYLYLGWTRASQSGTTNFDFEINQAAQPDLTTPGPKALVRTTGDLLFNYLFQGQGTPQINFRTWNGTTWSAATSLATSAEAAINGGNTANPFGSPSTLPAQQFGETAIDLTAANIIPLGVCKGFSSAYVKSRASTSFNSEIKDFVAPLPVNIATCSRIIVDKVTVPSGSTQSFHFNASYNASGFDLTDAAPPNDTGFTLSPGTYSVSENLVANWDLTSATCDNGDNPSAITLGANQTVKCTFTNTLQLGAIKVTKNYKHAAAGPGDHPQAGVNFTVNGVTKATGADGTACFDGLPLTAYDVTETLPTGYVNDTPLTQSVTVDHRASCADSPYVGETVTFHNTPLTDISVSVNSQVDGGTASTIDCGVASGSTGANGDGSVTKTDLTPGTYTCTIVVDP
jgi:hypothetical protein